MDRAEPKNKKVQWDQNGIICLNLLLMKIRERMNK